MHIRNHRRITTSILCLTLASAPTCAQEFAEPKLVYPAAKRVEATNVYHGEKVTDPYQWMEDSRSTDLTKWLKSQVELTDSYFDPQLWQRFRTRIAELESSNQRYAPIKAGEKYFYSEFPSVATDKTSIYVRDNATGQKKKLVAPPYHYGDSVDPDVIRFNGFAPSNDGRTVAYVTSGDGSVWHRVRFTDVNSGRILSDELRGLNRISASVSWSQHGDRLYYVRFDEPSDDLKLNAPVLNGRVFMHILGKDQSEDTLVFTPDHNELVPSVAASIDGAYVIVHVLDPRTQNNRVFIKNSTHEISPIQELFRNRSARFTYLDNSGTDFWFYTNERASNGRVIRIDIATGKETVVIQERDEPMSGGSLVGGNAMGKFADQFVILYMINGLPVIRVFDLEGRLKHETPAPIGGSVWGGFVGRPDDPEVFFGFIGMFDPFAVYRMDAQTGEYAPYSSSRPKALNADEFKVSQVFYESHDGTRVPMFLVHKNGVQPDGSNPALLYGYGAFGWNSFLYYQSHVIAWLEMGGVYAQPGLRGGGEYGQDWHDAGKGVKKENTIGDFIAAAEWLIDNGYANPETLVVNGGSASAMPAATAMQRRPDIFGAAIIDRPALDMLRFNRFTQGRLWLDEFGAPDTPEDFLGLRRLSPYHNLVKNKCYPPTMLMVGESDPVTPPLHGYKYTAGLQHAQGCTNPVLLYLMPKTAHTFGSTPAQVINSRTAMMVFLIQALGLDPQ